MNLLFVFLFLTASLLHVHCSVQLVESGPGTVKPGGSLRLTCTVTGDSIKNKYWEWVRQAPGKGLEWLGQIDWNNKWRTYYASSLQGRITLSADASSNTYSLQLNSLTAADTATYYCARRMLAAAYYFDYWGQGTMVTVTSATPTAPAVFPLSPCCQGTADVTLACLITGYFPEPVQVQWNSGAITSGFKTFPSIRQSSGHHTLSSQLTIPDASWKSGKFQCNVVHTATNSRINGDFEACQSKDPVAPVARMLQSSCTTHSGNTDIELMCIISNFYPKEVTVSWLRDGQAYFPSFTDNPWKDDNGYTFSTTSSVNITQQDWQDEKIFTCQVSHEPTKSIKKVQAKKCGDDDGSTKIRVRIEKPTLYDLYIERQPILTCNVNNVVSKEGLVVTWSKEKPGTLTPEPLVFGELPDGTFTAASSLEVPARDWMTGETFSCKVEHPELAGPIIKKISKESGTATAPSVYIFRPHHDELNSDSQDLSITALIKGFKPSDISVKWLKGTNPLPEANYINTPVTSDGDDTFFFYSKLKVPKADWNNGNSFTCMVVHEGLAMKFIQKSIQKTFGK